MLGLAPRTRSEEVVQALGVGAREVRARDDPTSDSKPTTLPSSTTGRPEIRSRARSSAASFNGVSGGTVVASRVMASLTLIRAFADGSSPFRGS